MALKDFLAEYPTAAKDTEQSRADIRYAVYQESAFRYEFLDEQLFSIRYSLPKTQQSADEAVVEYEAVLGPPTSTLMPEGLHQLHAAKFVRWDLPEHHFRINFAYFPSDIVEADLLLFGQFVHLKRAQEFLKRSNQPSRDSGRRSQSSSRVKTSAAQREIQEQIDDPKWGSVAATINRLCTGQNSDEAIHRHILKTIQLAREGGFTPEFTLNVLQQGEDIANRRRLSTVTVVTSCQQSLAFGTSAAGEDH